VQTEVTKQYSSEESLDPPGGEEIES